MTQTYRNVTCPHCAGSLEVAGEISPGETVRLECPHCQQELTICEQSQPKAPPIIPGAQAIWFGSEQSFVEVRLISGASLKIRAVQLYSESKLQELATKKAAAAELLGGVQSPLGFIGNGAGLLAQILAARALEVHYSNKAAKQGVEVLSEVFEQERKLRADVRFFPFGQIQEIEYPSPHLWRVPSQPSGFVHSGDEFVLVKDEHDTPQSLRWSAVEFFRYYPNAESPDRTVAQG